MGFTLFKDDDWSERVKLKLIGASTLASVQSLFNIDKYRRTFLQDFPKRLSVYSGATLLFCGLQEGIRSARSGKGDSWNSLVAGSITGALLVGHYQGPQYRFLGAVVWGTLSSTFHLWNQIAKPRYFIEDFFIENDLLSPKVVELRPIDSRSAQRIKRSMGIQETAELMADVDLIRRRELQELHGIKPTIYYTAMGSRIMHTDSTFYFTELEAKKMRSPENPIRIQEWREALEAAQEPTSHLVQYRLSATETKKDEVLQENKVGHSTEVEFVEYDEVEDDEDFQKWLKEQDFDAEKV
mmetsp:Transcript_11236/g.20342  ORF Transcript_11236/g.20342 Transcript_11236/m.20342 type:complete len:297 (-) Transcript_11236:305-1195(-)